MEDKDSTETTRAEHSLAFEQAKVKTDMNQRRVWKRRLMYPTRDNTTQAVVAVLRKQCHRRFGRRVYGRENAGWLVLEMMSLRISGPK